MPYSGGLILGISVIGLAVFFGAATWYCFKFFKQMVRSRVRWHKNVVSRNTLPPLPLNPQYSSRTKRRFRNVALWALVVFGACFVLACAVLMLQAGTLGFWHHWHWFVK